MPKSTNEPHFLISKHIAEIFIFYLINVVKATNPQVAHNMYYYNLMIHIIIYFF